MNSSGTFSMKSNTDQKSDKMTSQQNATPNTTQTSISDASVAAATQNGVPNAYFQYYSQLIHQQNMLSDYVRTNLYQQVVQLNAQECFQDKIVMDIGAGSGVLSFFSCQAGARRVFAIEASQMAEKMKMLIEKSLQLGNANAKWLGAGGEDKIKVYQDKIENLVTKQQIAPKSVDTIISEPIGVFLVHERMLESFILARDHYLKPGGRIFPTTGVIHLAPFSDQTLYAETIQKARWWQQQDFFGIDFSSFFSTAAKEAFSMAVVGSFSPFILLSNPTVSTSSYTIDFRYATVPDLQEIFIPIRWVISYTGILHGIASWFDCHFFPGPVYENERENTGDGQYEDIVLSTHPSSPLTHWQQIRFLFQEPLAVNANDVIAGWLRGKTNSMRSYSLESEIWIEDSYPTPNSTEMISQARPNSKRAGKWELQDQTYYYPNNATPGGAALGQNLQNLSSMSLKQGAGQNQMYGSSSVSTQQEATFNAGNQTSPQPRIQSAQEQAGIYALMDFGQ